MIKWIEKKFNIKWNSKEVSAISFCLLFLSSFVFLTPFADGLHIPSFGLSLLACLGIALLVSLLIVGILILQVQTLSAYSKSFDERSFFVISTYLVSIEMLIFALISMFLVELPLIYLVVGILLLMALGFVKLKLLYQHFNHQYEGYNKIFFIRILKWFYFGNIGLLLFFWLII